MIFNIINKKVYVYGLGISGMSLALELSGEKCEILCWDDDKIKRKVAKQSLLKVVSYKKISYKKLDYFVLTPIMKSVGPLLHPAVDKAHKNGIKIISDIEFLIFLKKKRTIIGVTGTNGKSTTTKFIESSLSGKKTSALACGNIGKPITRKNLKNINGELIVEASSFQLDRIDKLQFKIAVLLNISEDHLDWHHNMNSYIKAKLKIFKNQDRECFSVICIDDKHCKKISTTFKKNYKSNLITISLHDSSADIKLSIKRDFLEIKNKKNHKLLSIKKDKLNFTLGKHNYQNLLAAYTVNFLVNRDDSFISKVSNLKNLEHRIEFVTRIENISFFNDSKSTNLNSAITALDSLDNNLWLLGGRKKEGNFFELGKYSKKIIHAFVFGESKKELESELKKHLIKISVCDNIEEAFETAFQHGMNLKLHINILFSPACSSFDQFNNFSDRGKHFKRLVQNKYEKYNL